MGVFFFFFFLAASIACRAPWARDWTCATAVTTWDHCYITEWSTPCCLHLLFCTHWMTVLIRIILLYCTSIQCINLFTLSLLAQMTFRCRNWRTQFHIQVCFILWVRYITYFHPPRWMLYDKYFYSLLSGYFLRRQQIYLPRDKDAPITMTPFTDIPQTYWGFGSRPP